MAIQVGEATPRDGDYLAPALNRLARLTAASHAGQILLTDAARERLGAPPDDVALADLGRHRLRDLLEAEPVFQITAQGLPDAFPPLNSLDGVPHNLPVQPTRLVGREADRARVHDALRSGDRLVTLLGPGGVGKTRLALQAAADELGNFPDGAWWIPLASITDPQLVLEAIASAMPLRLPSETPLVDALPGLLRSRRDLLILDNLEQVTDAGPIIGNLMAASPSTVALVTSRLPLGLPDETTILIDPLPLPNVRGARSTSETLDSPAVQLFVERAQAVRAGFELTPENVNSVVGICDRLDGLPLALELAAARIRVLAPDALLARLDRSLNLLTGGARDLPTRQQTLRGAIQWSYDLLSAEERTAFTRLAVMAPAFTSDAAARTLRTHSDPAETVASLENLSEQSLLRRTPGADAAIRWDMLSTIQAFARECLQSLPEAPALQLAHAHAYLAIAEESEWFEVTNQPDLAATFEADLDNYRVALRTFQDHGVAESHNMIRLATMLADFWWIRGHTTEGRQWLDTAIASAGSQRSLDLGRALAAAGLLAEAQSDLSAARTFQERALEVFRAEGHASGVADSLTGLAVIARSEGDLNRARVLHQEAYDVWSALGDEQGAAGALLDLGVVSYLRGDYANAQPILLKALHAFHAVNDLPGEAYARQSLAAVAAFTNRLEDAEAGFRASLTLWDEVGNEHASATDRMNLAEVLTLTGKQDEATSLLLDSLAEFEALADPAKEGTVIGLLARIRLQQGQGSEAEAMAVQSLRLTWEHRDLAGTASSLDVLAEVAVQKGAVDTGRTLVQASNALRLRTGLRRLPAYTRVLLETIPALNASLPEDETPESVVEGLLYRGLRR
jgi:predicted ATPase